MTTGKRPTIKDVAATAGVSLKTVSRVVNNEKNVSESVRRSVSAAIDQLGYSPNIYARGLGGAASGIIGMLSHAPVEAYRDNYSFYMNYQISLIGHCRDRGYILATEIVGEDGAAELQRILGSLNFDGLVVLPPVSDNIAVIAEIEKRGIRFVRVAPTIDRERSDFVAMDDCMAADDATTALLDLGHRRIGFLAGHPDHGASEARRTGYINALRREGIRFDPSLIEQGRFTAQSGADAAQALLKRHPEITAIFAANDMMALGACRTAEETGRRIPGDLSVIGFDGQPEVLAVRPDLATISQPLSGMAERAIAILTDPEKGKSPRADIIPHVFRQGTTIGPV